jgi:hypothetical protein
VLALITALGGTAYAAVTVTGSNVRDGSLTGADIKNGTVSGSDIRNNTIFGSDIRESAINSDDIADGSITAADLHDGVLSGAAGPKGDTGPKGDKGETGAPGPAGSGSTGSSTVVDRARSVTPVTPATRDPVTFPVALTGASWTQKADEVDQLVGSANITLPAGCVDGANYPGGVVEVSVSVGGGTPILVGSAGQAQSPGTFEVPVRFTAPTLFEPGADAVNTFSAVFYDFCDSGPHATLNSLRLDAIGTR